MGPAGEHDRGAEPARTCSRAPRRALCIPALALAFSMASWTQAGGQTPGVSRLSGASADGARYLLEKPANWNGVLLLYAHGYAMRDPGGPPAPAPPGLEAVLLSRGYGLAASSYASPGWVLDSAPKDQLDAAAEFAKALGKPRLTIAWGSSMGGLVTAALAERTPRRIDGALPMCGSVGGAVGMMNLGLDGAFVFKALLAPDDAGIRLTGTKDDLANGREVAAVLQKAQAAPQGRARIALAAALAGIPRWTDPSGPEPAPSDAAAAEADAAKAFATGVFLPRADQEARAGGVFSWNDGVDYRIQLDRSGRRAEIDALYRAAGLDLAIDLAKLAQAPRIRADPRAVSWMKANFTPTGRIFAPVLTMHTIGDGVTSPTLERGYLEAIRTAGRGRDLVQLYVARAGHCDFTIAEQVAALETLRSRLETGRWPRLDTAWIAARARATGLGPAAFTVARPTPFLRFCAGDRRCPGEPAGEAH